MLLPLQIGNFSLMLMEFCEKILIYYMQSCMTGLTVGESYLMMIIRCNPLGCCHSSRVKNLKCQCRQLLFLILEVSIYFATFVIQCLFLILEVFICFATFVIQFFLIFPFVLFIDSLRVYQDY